MPFVCLIVLSLFDSWLHLLLKEVQPWMLLLSSLHVNFSEPELSPKKHFELISFSVAVHVYSMAMLV